MLTTISAGETATGWWEMASARSALPAGAIDAGYGGYREHSLTEVRRREVPNGRVSIIISFGDPIEIVEMTNSPSPGGTHCSFVVGFHEGHAITSYLGAQLGVELDLSPLDAYRLLGVPMRHLANDVVTLDELGDRTLDELPERLAALGGWEDRFALLDELLLARTAEGPPVDPAIEWAWSRLVATDGAARVGELAAVAGWSRRHFAERFRDEVGLAPKTAARILRFSRAAGLLRDGGTTAARVAAECGYADQSHLNRDFRRLAGCTPAAYARATGASEVNGVAS